MLPNQVRSKETTQKKNTSCSDSGKPKSKRRVYNFSDDDMRLSRLLHDLLMQNNPNRKSLTEEQLERWANDCRLMRENDGKNGRTIEEIELVLQWSQSDLFWKNNILSMGKLRKQFDQLFLKRKAENDKTSTKMSSDSFSDGSPYPEADVTS